MGKTAIIDFASRKIGRTIALGLANTSAPGLVEIDTTARSKVTPRQIAKDLANPLTHFTRPQQIAAMALVFAGPETASINGQRFEVSAGSVMT